MPAKFPCLLLFIFIFLIDYAFCQINNPGFKADARIEEGIKGAKSGNRSFDSSLRFSSGGSTDFTYSQNTFSPKTVTLFASDQSSSNYSWDFGNGVKLTGTGNPSVTYENYGTYTIQLISSNSGATEIIKKEITIANQQANIILTPDTTICSGSSLQLSTIPGINFSWKPDTAIKNINTATTTVAPTKNSTYYFTSEIEGANLLINGNFSQGNTGFNSDYSLASPNTKEGQYYISNDSYTWNLNFNRCIEHTTGTGNMMMVNGSAVAGSIVWSQQIPISRNTNYSLSVWVESLAALSPTNLRFSINGIVLGDTINAGTVACQWKKFITTWNSGSATRATIAIINNDTSVNGNDFAIDDISFSEVFMNQDSVKVNVAAPPLIRTRADTAICEGTSIQLPASGGAVYSWLPASGLSNLNAQNPIVQPDRSTTYVVSAYNTRGCAGTDTVKIDVIKRPDIKVSNDTTVCTGNKVQLFAAGGSKYVWAPDATLTSLNVNNPVASPVGTTNYFVTVSETNGCSATDTVLVRIAAQPVVSTISNTTICQGTPVTLQTTSTSRVVYSWFPGSGLSDSTVASPVATPPATIDYIVTVRNGFNCEAKDTVRVAVLGLPALKTSNDTILCNPGKVSLFATGGASYTWSPASGLADPNINNPVASVDKTTTYLVSVKGNNGCSKSNSVKLTIRTPPVFKIQPAEQAVCKNEKLTLSASGGNSYRWLNPSSPILNNNASLVVTPTINTVYRVSVYDSVCKVADTLDASITVKSLPVVAITKSNDIDCSFTSAILTATGGEKYLWTSSSPINNATIANPLVSPAITSNYKVKVTNVGGCSAYDSIRVAVSYNSRQSKLELPTAFTPNSDGKNDCFGIKALGPVEKVDFSIYSRWGERVFYTKNVTECWDGTYKSRQQDTGSFIYYIRGTSACGGEFEKKGTVVLLR